MKFENPSSGSKVSKGELGETGENQGKLNNERKRGNERVNKSETRKI